MSSPTASPLPPIPTTKCIRCTTYGLQCCVEYATMACWRKLLCHHCEAAGVDQCLFLPSAWLLLPMQKFNNACIHCQSFHRKCIFQSKIDPKCTRCTKSNIPCVFKLNGEWLLLYYSYTYDVSHLITIPLAQGSCTDITKRKFTNVGAKGMPANLGLTLYAMNRTPPSWIRVFYPCDEPSSRRTQAAAVVYMFPLNGRRMAIHLCLLITATRNEKIAMFSTQ